MGAEGKILRVEAGSREEAIKTAWEQIQKEEELSSEITPEDILEVKQVEEKKAFLGLNKKTIYIITIKDIEEGLGEPGQEGYGGEGILPDKGIDGSFSLRFSPAGVMLKVEPPEGQGEVIGFPRVKKAINRREVVDVNWQQVQDAVREGAGRWVKIASRKPELDRDAQIEVKVDRKGLKAHLDYLPPLGGKGLLPGQIRDILGAKGITFGIMTQRLTRIARSKTELTDYLIAEGIPPQHGRDTMIDFHFETDIVKKIGTKRDDGSIDFHNLNLVQSVSRGDKLATILPPTAGKPGKDVYGKEIPARDGVKKDPVVGNGAEIREDAVYAIIDGQPRLERKKITVDPVFTVPGDVDLSVGNIDFAGSVLIKGSVQKGFRVKARGDVEIGQSISGAIVEAGGSVAVKKGIIGQKRGAVEADGNIVANFVESATLVAKESVMVGQAIMHSRVTAGKEIVVEGKGLIVGGRLEATGRIKGNVLGSSFATPTEMIVGIDPELRNELHEYRGKIQELEESKEKLIKTCRYLSKKPSLRAKEKHIYNKCLKTRKLLEKQYQQLIAEKEALEEKVEESRSSCVIAGETIYPRVNVTIGNDSKSFQDTAGPSKLLKEDGEIRVLPL